MPLNKNWSRQGGEERTQDYRVWRNNAKVLGVCDVDQIEYRMVGDVPEPAAVVELCVADMASTEIPGGVRPDGQPSPAFLEAALQKVGEHRLQGLLLRRVAAALHVPLLVVVYVAGHLAEKGLWVCRIGGDGWKWMPLEEYRERLTRLPTVSLRPPW